MKFRLCPLGREGRWQFFFYKHNMWNGLGNPSDKTDLMTLVFYALRGLL